MTYRNRFVLDLPLNRITNHMKINCLFIIALFCSIFLYKHIAVAANSNVIFNYSKLKCGSANVNLPISVIGDQVRFKGLVTTAETYRGIATVHGINGPRTVDMSGMCLLQGHTSKGVAFSGILYDENGSKLFKLTSQPKRTKSRGTVLTRGEVSEKSEYHASYSSSTPRTYIVNKLNDNSCDSEKLDVAADPIASSVISSNNTSSSIGITKTQPLTENLVSAATKVTIAADCDSTFYASKKSNPFPEMARRINTASTVYRQQLGFDLVPGNFNCAESASVDPYANQSNPSTLLDIFAYKAIALARLKDGGIYHLFISKSIGKGVLGIAFMSQACGLVPFGLTTDFEANAVVVPLAHEIGHSFGAKHDDQAKGTIMNSRLPADSKDQERFSTTSLSQINNYINATSTRYASCYNGGKAVISPITTYKVAPPPSFSISFPYDSKTKVVSVKTRTAYGISSKESKYLPYEECTFKLYLGTDKTKIDKKSGKTNLVDPANLVVERKLTLPKINTGVLNSKSSQDIYYQAETVCPGVANRYGGPRKISFTSRKFTPLQSVDANIWRNSLKTLMSQ